jgi:hypothetical protein
MELNPFALANPQSREELREQIARLMGANELYWQQIREREALIASNIKEASRLMNILMKLAGE